MTRITVVPYTFYSCCIYIDHTAGYLTVSMIKTSKPLFSSLASSQLSQLRIFMIEGKLPLFYYYILVLCSSMYVENRWFEEKWVLMHLHFALDGQISKNRKFSFFYKYYIDGSVA